MSSGITIRPIAPEDTEAACKLSAELGYEIRPEVMGRRIAAIADSQSRAVYVAERAGSVIAWMDLSVGEHLTTGPYVEIGGLVVASGSRSAGVGRALIAEAERWASAHGIPMMLVRSRVSREAAHRFYIREGYQMTKTSAVFTKMLS